VLWAWMLDSTVKPFVHVTGFRMMTERRCVKSVAARAVPGGVLGLIRGSLRLNHMLRWFTYDVGIRPRCRSTEIEVPQPRVTVGVRSARRLGSTVKPAV
jgi:hypothetical protein